MDAAKRLVNEKIDVAIASQIADADVAAPRFV